MLFQFRGENLELTPAIKNYAETKIERIQKYFAKEITSTVHINFKVYKHGQKVEVTINLPKLTLRAEETNQDLYAALDIVVDKLERQIRKNKTKINRKYRDKGNQYNLFEAPEASSEEQEDQINIVRQKDIQLTEMDAEEAILNMNMLGHNFYLFIDVNSGQNAVVYRRGEDSYGFIKTNN